MKYQKVIFTVLFFSVFIACKKGVKQHEDSIYSKHLQTHLALTILTTPMPDDKADLNLLLFNNSKDLQQLDAKKIIDSLYKKKLIQPLVVVAIEENQNNYGLAGLGSETNTTKYSTFIDDELYPFVKKKVTTRKFKSITIAGCSRAGVSAFDIAWNYADKINKVGIFSPTFDYADKTDSGKAALAFIKSSRKRPKLQLWLYAAGNENNIVLNNVLSLKQILEDKSSITPDDITLITDKNGTNDYTNWRNQFAAFILWAFAK
jgi:enterochelin esterase-like enzyme